MAIFAQKTLFSPYYRENEGSTIFNNFEDIFSQILTYHTPMEKMEKALLIIYPNETKLCRKFRTFLAFFEKKNPMAHKMCAFGAQI